MLTYLDAGRVVLGNAIPAHAGKALAAALLAEEEWGTPLKVSVRGLRSEQLISAFFHQFLHDIANDPRRDRLAKARAIVWETDHDFQLVNIARWMQQLPVGNRIRVYVAAPNRLAALTRTIMDRIDRLGDFEAVSASTHTDQTLSPRAIFDRNVELIRGANLFVAVLKDYGKDLTAEVGMAYMLRRCDSHVDRLTIGLDYTADPADVMSYHAFDNVVAPDQLETILTDWVR